MTQWEWKWAQSGKGAWCDEVRMKDQSSATEMRWKLTERNRIRMVYDYWFIMSPYMLIVYKAVSGYHILEYMWWMKQNVVQKMIFFNWMHCSKSRYVKRAIDVVPVKFGPVLPLFQMKVRHSTDGFSIVHLHINHCLHQHLWTCLCMCIYSTGENYFLFVGFIPSVTTFPPWQLRVRNLAYPRPILSYPILTHVLWTQTRNTSERILRCNTLIFRYVLQSPECDTRRRFISCHGCSQWWTPPLGLSFPRQSSSTSLCSFVSCTGWRLQSGLHLNMQSSCTKLVGICIP